MKKTISLILCLAMIMSTMAFSLPALAVLDFSAETSEDYAQPNDPAALSGTKGDNDGKPGYNIITGTKDAYGFDDGYTHGMVTQRDAAVETDPDNAENKVLRLGTQIYTNINLTPGSTRDNPYKPLMEGKTLEANRPIHLTFKARTTTTTADGKYLEFFSGLDNHSFEAQGGIAGWVSLKGFELTDEWAEYSFDTTYANVTKSSKTFLVCFAVTKNHDGHTYIDDVSLIPDYRVVYFDSDGSKVLEESYVSYKEAGNKYTYTADDHKIDDAKFLGFKVKGTDDSAILADGAEIVYGDSDIELVAVYDKNLIAPEQTDATSGAKFEVTSKVAVTEWVVEDDMDGDLVKVDSKSASKITLEAKGYNGLVTVTAKYAEDEETVKVHLKGSKAWRPGANFMTGTTEPVTFENTWEEYTLHTAFKVVDAKGGNTSAKMIAQEAKDEGGQTYLGFNVTNFDYSTYDKERPMRFTFKYNGAWNNIWAFFVDGSNAQFSGGNSNGGWATYKYDIVPHAKSNGNYVQFGKNINKNLYIDDISVVPFYKVTYKNVFGDVASTEYVLPENGILTVKDDLNADLFAGYALEGTTEAVTEIKLAHKDIVLVPIAKAGVEFEEPSSAAPIAGTYKDADPRYPGVVYTFAEALDEDTITDAEIEKLGGAYYEYDADAKTLAVWSNNIKTVGAKDNFTKAFSGIMTESGKHVLFNDVDEIAYASEIPNDGKNMIPYGDMESAYLPFYVRNTTSLVLSGKNGWLEANAATDAQDYPHVSFATSVKNGATYKLYATVKSLGTQADPEATSNVFVNVIYDGDVTGDLHNHGSIDGYHVFKNEKEIAAESDFAAGVNHVAEFNVTLDNDADTAAAEVSIFSEPNETNTTGFAIDNFELYRRTDVVYKPNASVSTEGVDAPAVDGAYLYTKGNVKADKAEVTAAANPYKAIDAKRDVDGWKSTTDGIVYKAGDKIDLTKVELNANGEYVLVPNIVAADGYELIDVTFSGDVKNIPDDLIGGYAVGDTIKMADFYAGVTSAVDGKRFNGWSTTGKVEDIVPHDAVLTAEKDLHFTAIVNYDLNFALEDTQKLAKSDNLWTSGSEYVFEDGYLKATHTKGKDADVNLSISGLSVPAGDVYKVIWWVDPEYYVWNDSAHTGEQTKKTIAKGTYFEGLFFSHPGQGDNAGRNIGVTAEDTYTTSTGKTLIALPAYSTQSSSWDTTKTIAKLRFDPNNIYGNLSYRYIQFVEFPKHDVSELKVTGLDAPVVGAVPDTEVSVDEIAKITSITWSPEVEYGFDEQTAYTATVTIASADASKQFKKGTKVYIDGVEADEVTFNADNSINAKITFPKTGNYIKFDMSITGPETISKAGRTTQYKLVFSEKIPLETATWSVAEGCEIYGSIDSETGKVVPYMNCDEFTIIATSNYNKKISAEFTVKFENQGTTTITYDPNTTDKVEGMPEPEESGMLAQLSTAEPTRKGYAFAGWSTSPESRETVTFITAESEETTVYAVWDKLALALEFNGDDDYALGGLQNTSSLTIKNGYLEAVSTGSDIRLSIGKYSEDMGFAIPASAATDVRMRMSLDGFTQTPQIFVSKLVGSNCVNGAIISGELGGLDDYAVFQFNLASKAVDGYVKAFWLDPFEKASSTCRIDYIRFFDKNRVVTFNANTKDEVTLPENISAEVGSTVSITAKASRDGYEFIGWSKSADSVELVSSLYLGDDIDLYAVWAKKVDVEDSSNVVLESVSEETLVISAAAKSEVTVTVTTENGTETITGKTDANGKFVADLSEVEGTITNVEIAGTGITGVVEASKEVADEMTSDKKDEGTSNKPSSDILINGKDNSGSSGTSSKKWDTTVTDTTKPGTIKPSSGDDESGATPTDIKSIMAQEGDILINFDSEGDAEFFPTKSLRQFTLGGVNDSVISYTNKGLASGSNDSPALFTSTFALNADTHRYIVMKAKYSSDNAISIYFNDGKNFAEAKRVAANVTSEYTMMVYDMASNENWKGTISALSFSFGKQAGDVVDIDWILFTDNVPESMDEIAGTKDLFPIVNKDEMNFTDVKADDWFYSEVLSAYRLGFVTGTTASTYEPDGQVTVAEAITLAVRLNYSYNGTELPAVADGAEWYVNYVNAAVRAGIIKSTQFDDYNRAATRSEVASMMYKALPRDYLNAINMFTSIPDVSTKNSAYGAIRTLYNAGVVIGSDEAYNFYPDSNITRAEMAAIVNRMAIPSNRKRVVTEAEIESRKKYYYAEDLELAELGNCYAKKLTIKNGLATGTGSTGDPIIYLTNVLGQFNGKEVTKITVGAKWDFSAQGGTPQIFFTTPSGGWAAERMLKSTKGELKEDGIQEFIFDVSSNSQFANTITALRFDPFDAKDIEFSVAYIVIE